VATNVSVRLRRGESSERLIRRFVKKCKRERVVDIYKEKISHHIKPSVKKKLKRKRAIREQQKLQRRKDNKLFR
jgi:ribosomal protein S21